MIGGMLQSHLIQNDVIQIGNLQNLKKKWLSPRGSISPLYYLDWGDLVKIIRKNEAIFNTYFPSIKFVELKLEELENIRNIVAHNGVLPDDSEFERVKLYFNDWCKQLKKL